MYSEVYPEWRTSSGLIIIVHRFIGVFSFQVSVFIKGKGTRVGSE